MLRWAVICCALLVLVCADYCPDGGRCKDGQTCCSDPDNGYKCCPFDQAECCEDHIHCCPEGTICNTALSSCVNGTVSIAWAQRFPTQQQYGLSKSFRMINSHIGPADDHMCPDGSRCPPEFSCLKALKKFACCPLAQGIACSDGKHCCPEGHRCSANSRSCIKKEFVSAVLCSDGVSECPDETTCCETPDGSWGCCPMPKAVCCEDKLHCCHEGTICDLKQLKCISLSTKKEMPMWAKLPARRRAEWENRKKGELVSAKDDDSEKVPEFTAANTLPHFEKKESVSPVTKAAAVLDVPCNGSVSCPDQSTCCKNKRHRWRCCPYPEGVCCANFKHCCPKGSKCSHNHTCIVDLFSVPPVEEIPTIPEGRAEVGYVQCDSTYVCPDNTTCCKTTTGEWACCLYPQAVCCEDHMHCCPAGMICNLAAQKCDKPSGSAVMKKKIPAFTFGERTTVVAAAEGPPAMVKQQRNKAYEDEVQAEEEKKKEEDGKIQCDSHTTCPQDTTCCFMVAIQKWGCCVLPHAVCCADGMHCCPAHYKCDLTSATCYKGDMVIPWYTKISATTTVPADVSSVPCDADKHCPEHTTCCRLATGEWGCCPLNNGVCCPDKKHCCPQGYSCNMASGSCQKLTLQLQIIPLVPVFQPEPRPQLHRLNHRDVKCDEQTSCPDDNTCCRTSATTWGCCPAPHAVCCRDMKHCCPAGYTCTDEGKCI